jgi:hypothetical protein
MRLTSTTAPRRAERKIIPCEYHSKPVAKVGTAEPPIEKRSFCNMKKEATKWTLKTVLVHLPVDWICQVDQKGWATDKCVASLIRA